METLHGAVSSRNFMSGSTFWFANDKNRSELYPKSQDALIKTHISYKR